MSEGLLDLTPGESVRRLKAMLRLIEETTRLQYSLEVVRLNEEFFEKNYNPVYSVESVAELGYVMELILAYDELLDVKGLNNIQRDGIHEHIEVLHTILSNSMESLDKLQIENADDLKIIMNLTTKLSKKTEKLRLESE